jgi:hypothetical protein
MNYLQQILAFDAINAQNPLSAEAQTLYRNILSVFNADFWRNNVLTIDTHKLEYLCQLTRKKLGEARNLLIQRGLIRYYKKSGSASPDYKIFPLYQNVCVSNKTQTEAQIATYLQQVLAFDAINAQNPLSAEAQTLYRNILSVFNADFWRNNVLTIDTHKLEYLCQLTRKKLGEARNLLIQRGLIRYYKKSGSASPDYKIFPLYQNVCVSNKTQTEAQIATQTETQIATQTEAQKKHKPDSRYIGLKQRKTREEDDTEANTATDASATENVTHHSRRKSPPHSKKAMEFVKTRNGKPPKREPDGEMLAGWTHAARTYPLTFNTNPKSAQEAYYHALWQKTAETGATMTAAIAALQTRIEQFAATTRREEREPRFTKGFHTWLKERGWEIVAAVVQEQQKQQEFDPEREFARAMNQQRNGVLA